MRVLLVEDDPQLGSGVQTWLQHSGYAVDWLTDGMDARRALDNENSVFDIVVLDLGLPGMDGLKLLEQIRAKGHTLPVIILTARDTVHDRVLGLDSGADDYLIKPFDLDELQARMRALARRQTGRATPVIEYGDITLDPASHTVMRKGELISLSVREYSVLSLLLENAGRVLSRERIEESLYGWNDAVESNATEVHIHHLRKKLGKGLIVTIRGIGYMVPKAA